MVRFLLVCLPVFALLGLAPAAWGHGVTVEIDGDRVTPSEVTVPAGTTIHFHNLPATPGRRTIVAVDGSFRSPGLSQGEGWHHTFLQPGIHSFYLREHPGTTGKVIVVEPPP